MKKIQSQYHNKWRKSQSNSIKIRNKMGLHTIPLLFTIVLVALARAIQQENNIKGM